MAKCVSDVACAWAWHQPATNMHFNVGRTAKYGARMIAQWNKDHNEKQLRHADSVARQNKNHAKLMRATTKSIVWPGTAKKIKHTELKTTQSCHSAHDTPVKIRASVFRHSPQQPNVCPRQLASDTPRGDLHPGKTCVSQLRAPAWTTLST